MPAPFWKIENPQIIREIKLLSCLLAFNKRMHLIKFVLYTYQNTVVSTKIHVSYIRQHWCISYNLQIILTQHLSTTFPFNLVELFFFRFAIIFVGGLFWLEKLVNFLKRLSLGHNTKFKIKIASRISVEKNYKYILFFGCYSLTQTHNRKHTHSPDDFQLIDNN